MKKYLIFALGLGLTFGLVSCGKAKGEQRPTTTGSGKSEAGIIAYVEYDSIMSQYEFVKEKAKVLEDRANSLQQQAMSKQKAAEAAAAAFQKKLQSGGITSEAQYKSEGEKVQKMVDAAQRWANEEGMKIQEEQNKLNQILSDSLHNFIKDFNADKRYSLILTKIGDNILYADDALNITEEVVKGLNKRYKK